MNASLALVGAVCGLAVAWPTVGRAQSSQALLAAAEPLPFTADDVLWMEVRADTVALAESMDVYSSRAGVFVPLGQFSRILDLAIGVFPAQRRAEGWVISRERTVTVDLAEGVAIVAGRSIPFAPNQAAIYDDDLYVRLDLAQQILPVRLSADTSGQLLTLTPTEPLPFQTRLERDARREGLATSGPRGESVVRLEAPYRLFTPPVFDVHLGGQLTRDGDDQSRRYDVRAAGDLAWAGFQGYLGSDEGGALSNVRVLLERKDPNGRALGPLGGTRSGLGDVFTPALAIGATSFGGRGLFYSSAPLETLDLSTPLNLRGELAVGEEVELYVNEVLRGSQSASAEGRYEFRDVPLSVGLNTLRLVFYGAQGQTREQVRRINFGSGQLEAGRLVVRLGAVEQGLAVFDVGAPIVDQQAGEARLVATVDYGLNSALTLSGGAARYTPRDRQARSLVTLGLRGSLGPVATQADVAQDDTGGQALSVGAAARPFGVSLVARHAEFTGGFIDETRVAGIGGGAPLARATDLRTAFQIEPVAGFTVPVTFDVRRTERTDRSDQTLAELRGSASINRYYVSSSVIWEEERTPLDRNQRLLGGADVATLVNANIQLRGGLTYAFSPDARLDTTYVTADIQLTETHSLRLAAVRALGPVAATSYQASYLRRARRFDVAVNGSYEAERDEWRLGLQLGFALAWNPARRAYRLARPGSSTGGMASVNAWIDDNGDGLRQASETPVPGILIEGPADAVLTDADGMAVASGLGDSASALVRLNTEAVEDPFLVGGPTVFETTPRPGRTVVINYPMVHSAEVEVTARLRRADNSLRTLSALNLKLVPASGGATIAARTDHAGVAFIEGVPPGEYDLRLDPDQAETLGLALAAPARLVVPADGGFVRTDDLVVITETDR